MDAREVETGEEREVGEDEEAEVRVVGEEVVVEPLAEGIGAGAGLRGGEGGGDGMVGGGGGEEGEGGAIGVGEGEEKGFRRGGRREDVDESVDARTSFGNGFPPGMH